MEDLVLRSTSQSVLHLIKIDGFEPEQNSESSVDDEVIGDSHLTNSSSDIDYEVPNVEQENNEKDVSALFTVTQSGRTAKNWRAFEYGIYLIKISVCFRERKGAEKKCFCDIFSNHNI